MVRLGWVVVACALAVGCAGTGGDRGDRSSAATGRGAGAAPAAASSTARPDGFPDLRVGEPARHENLAIYPIFRDGRAATTTARPPDAITLDDALAQKVAVLHEVGGDRPEAQAAASLGRRNFQNVQGHEQVALASSGASVNRLAIDNASAHPILIVGGEIVCGGQQDRVVAQDVVVPAGAKDFPLDVFCVESGRWAVRAGGDLDAATGAAVFSSTATGIADPKVREIAALQGEQQKVWAEVARKQSTLEARNLGVENESMSYAILAGNDRLAEASGAYVTALEAALDRLAEKPTGYIAAVDGRLVMAEVFGSPATASKLRAKLLRSYAVDAIAKRPAGTSAALSPPPPSPATALAFLVEGLGAERKGSTKAGAAMRFRLENAKMTGDACVEGDEIRHATLYTK